MTVEHLLLAIVDTPKVREILRACGADVARLRKDLKDFIDQTTPGSKTTTTAKCSRRWASSVSCSAPCSTCSRAARRK